MTDKRKTLANVAVGPQNTPSTTGPVIVQHTTLEPGYRTPAPPAQDVEATASAGPSNLRTRATGVVHNAADGQPTCSAAFRPSTLGYAETSDPVSCKHCLRHPYPAAAEPVPQEQADPLPDTEGETVETLANAGGQLSELEVRIAYTSGYLSAVTMLAEQVRAALGEDDPIWEEYKASILTDPERKEIARVVKQAIRRRRVEALPTATTTAGCAPWCVSHPGEVCYSAPANTDGVELAYAPGDDIRVNLHGDVDGLTVEQAEQLAHAILAQTTVARVFTPNPS